MLYIEFVLQFRHLLCWAISRINHLLFEVSFIESECSPIRGELPYFCVLDIFQITGDAVVKQCMHFSNELLMVLESPGSCCEAIIHGLESPGGCCEAIRTFFK